MREGQHDRAGDPAAVAGGAQQAQLRRPAQPGGGVHHLPGDVGAALDEVVHRVGHEQVAVGVEGGAQLRDGGLSGSASRVTGNGFGGQHRMPVADAAAGVLGAHREGAAQRLDVLGAADDAFHFAAHRLGQVRAVADFVGDPARGPRAARGDVQVPARRRVADRPVAQDRRGQRRRRRRRVQQPGRGRAGLAGRRRVDPAVGAERRAAAVPACLQGVQAALRDGRQPRVDAVAGGVDGGAQPAFQLGDRDRRRVTRSAAVTSLQLRR